MRDVPVAPVPLERLVEILHDDRAQALAQVAERARTSFEGRRIWTVNSTATGGGVAEMVKQVVAYSRSVGVDARWVVMDGVDEFFAITKRLHNRLHGEPGDDGELGERERQVYEEVTARAAGELLERAAPGDIVILHDPQPLGMARAVLDAGFPVVWRCHIGSDETNRWTEQGWGFLQPYADGVDRIVVSREAYAPAFCRPQECVVIAPAIDPLTAKNRQMSHAEAVAVAAATGLLDAGGAGPARFVREDGCTDLVRRTAEVHAAGPLPRADEPLVVQVSRWDRLKDMTGVLRAFVDGVLPAAAGATPYLLLVGPATAGVRDDPEGAAVRAACIDMWRALDHDQRRRVALVALPMQDVEENAAMVNAVQQLATVVTQKSLREGFGLTVAEAMWKSRPVVAGAVGGIVDQLTADCGVLVDPHDLAAFAGAVAALLAEPARAARLGAAARERVRERFLPDRHLADWAAVLEAIRSPAG